MVVASVLKLQIQVSSLEQSSLVCIFEMPAFSPTDDSDSPFLRQRGVIFLELFVWVGKHSL